jgi:Reverse transcriptase (RNA-dependent DNA polymerase)
MGDMADFEAGSVCFMLDAKALLLEPFTAAERHPTSFNFPATATGLHLSMEAYLGIGDRISKTTVEKVSDAMNESILDDIGPPDIGSSIDEIKYGPNLTPDQLAKLKSVVKRHRTVWERSHGVVDEPPEDWLQIRLKKDANLKSKGVYPLGLKDRMVVDELFDKLIVEGKMSKATEPNPVGWGVFVVRTEKPGDKGRVVIDTLGLNAAAEDDAYPLPRQEDVMSKIRWKQFIALLDQIKSYYQRVLHPKSHRHTAVISHRGQELFNVAMLGYKGSLVHQQKFMDKFLLEFIEWASSYIDDIVVGSHTFDEHLDHLDKLLAKMEIAKLALNPKKCWLAFQHIQLLGHIVDQFGIYTLEAKTAAN